MREKVDDLSLTALAESVASLCLAHDVVLATAESCTGGWVAKTLTDLAGSSAWFLGGVVSYSNALKQRLLGVRERTLQTHGAVSGETVSEMVSGALERLEADVALAVTGIAGPSGGSIDKPVGTVWIGWRQRGAEPRVERFVFAGNREGIRRQTVAAALRGVVKILTH